MRPTHISIVGRSKFLFWSEVASDLREGFLSAVVARIAPGPSVVFGKDVTSVDDAAGVIGFLMRRGIPRTDIRVRYPSDRPEAMLRRALERGLAESGLNFGADVAERDANLARYFILTEPYKAVESREKHVIVGPKGSGKSAILRELTTDNVNSLVITPEHYATDVLEALRKADTTTELAAYTTTWKYTLLIEIFRKLVENKRGDAKALANLRKYLSDHGHLGQNLSLSERFLSFLRKITQIKGKVGPMEGTIGVDAADELNRFFKMEELLGLIPSLQQVLRKEEFTVYLDELDQSWTSTQTANNFLISLLTAAIQLRSISDELHVVVFLRSEIFDLLKPHLPQLDKLRSDVSVLQWSRRELTNVIASRALDSLDIEADVIAEAAIKVLFPGTVAPADIPTFDYLLSRTSFRPREVIQFSNLALAIAGQEGLTAINAASVQRAEEQFSEWKLEHIVAENMYVHPQLRDLVERFRGRQKMLSYAQLDSLLADVLLLIPDSGSSPQWFKSGMEPVEVMRLMFEVELIGIERPAANGLDGRRLWESYDFVFARPKGRPEQSASFLFHPGVWKTLELL